MQSFIQAISAHLLLILSFDHMKANSLHHLCNHNVFTGIQICFKLYFITFTLSVSHLDSVQWRVDYIVSSSELDVSVVCLQIIFKVQSDMIRIKIILDIQYEQHKLARFQSEQQTQISVAVITIMALWWLTCQFLKGQMRYSDKFIRILW